MLHREVGVGGLGDLQLAALEHEPRQDRAELRDAGLGELLLELLEGAEVTRDGRGDVTGGGAAAFRFHRVPVKGVIPDLGGVVEDAAVGAHDHFFEALRRIGLPVEELVEVVDVGLVVLSVVCGAPMALVRAVDSRPVRGSADCPVGGQVDDLNPRRSRKPGKKCAACALLQCCSTRAPTRREPLEGGSS